MQLKMTPEPVKPTATAPQAPPRRVPAIEVHSASQPEEKSNTMAIPVYNPPSPDMLQPRHARHARLMASEIKLQEWLRAQSALAAATSPDHKPTTTEAEDTTKPSKPATFNTVGTIHNPNATAPIQPPTRRPRTRRFNGLQSPPGHHGYGPFPNSLLSALPVAEAEISPPPTKTTLPHYSPLQQNLDRAVSPFADAEKSQATVMSLPAIRAGNLPAPSTAALGTLSDLKDNTSTTGDDDSSTGDDILLASTFSVKSLTSLASYPNPMQKKAQNTLALAKARTAHYGINRPDTPSSLLSKPFVTGRNQSAILYGTTSAAIGTPQPLTAGPPGQRPYKPSAAESTYRILRSYDDEKAPLRTPPGFSSMENDSGARANPAVQSLSSRKDELHGPGDRLHSVSGVTPVDDRIKAARAACIEDTEEIFQQRFGNNNYLPSKISPNKVPILDTLPLDKAMHYFRDGLPSSYSGQTSILDDHWYERYPLQSRAVSWNQSPEEEAWRREKTNRIFYSGVRLLEKKASELLPISAARTSESKVGVIGGERREPNSNDEKECGDPLVTMALVSLLACKQGSKLNDPQNPFPSDWSKADPAWIDTSEDGNKSFFTTKPEPMKKKVARRVTRRGY